MDFNLNSLPANLLEIANDLGMAEIETRVNDLASWNRTATIAQIESGSIGDHFEMTPNLAIEWAVFAEVLAKETGFKVTVVGNYIMRPRTDEEMVKSVLNSEKWKRDQAAKKAADEAAEK